MQDTPALPDAGLVDRLASALPPEALLTGDAIGPRYQEDRRDRFSARPQFVLRPADTAQTATALALCHDAGQPLVIQGGRTGLSGAHRIAEGEAVLSLERMTDVGVVDMDNATVLAGAGAPLQTVQTAAQDADLFFGVDIGARGTATIGGNIATNAGGIRVLRYGMFRAQVAGLETVLADGTVLSSLRGLAKDNTGYDLNQLFIGAEGTLGVVTRALLHLHPRPQTELNALLALPSLPAALALLQRARRGLSDVLSAFEVMWKDTYFGICAHQNRPPPLGTTAPFYVLIECQSADAGPAVADRFTQVLMQALEDDLTLDAIVSQSNREFDTLWDIRDGAADFVRGLDRVANGDISIPLNRIEAFAQASQTALRRIDPDAGFYMFGHLGDGNLHYVFTTQNKAAALEKLYALTAEHGGSISAEHGIGVDKKPWLGLSRSPQELAVMRQLKRSFDPKTILNRGRLFDL